MNTDKARILVVEDEAIVAADIQDRLKSLGYDVIGPFDNGREAVEKTIELRPDVVLMDIMLKGDMMGTEAAEQIRREAGIPVIYLTANSNDSIFMKARETEPFGFILKPFEEPALRANIEIAIYKRRMEREREALVQQLQEALAQVKTLSGLMPICAWCKNVRSDQGYWQTVEQYIRANSDLTISHGVCPACQKKFEAEVMAKNAKSEPPA
jgi:two-component system, response regulator PdtaR